jgi:hypothetical protein
MYRKSKYEEVKEKLAVCQNVWESVYDDSDKVDDWVAPVSFIEANIHESLKALKDALEILNEELLNEKIRNQ